MAKKSAKTPKLTKGKPKDLMGGYMNDGGGQTKGSKTPTPKKRGGGKAAF